MRDILNDIDLSEFDKYLSKGAKNWFYGDAGNEHYRLLNHLCKGKKLVADIGTYLGASAIAMSSAKKVISYDIEKHGGRCSFPDNVDARIGDSLNKEVLSAEIILLDTYHDGVFEEKFINYLKENNYKGWLIMDDIRLFKELAKLWGKIDLPKEDLTNLGHHSGTGLVYFNEERI